MNVPERSQLVLKPNARARVGQDVMHKKRVDRREECKSKSSKMCEKLEKGDGRGGKEDM